MVWYLTSVVLHGVVISLVSMARNIIERILRQLWEVGCNPNQFPIQLLQSVITPFSHTLPSEITPTLILSSASMEKDNNTDTTGLL